MYVTRGPIHFRYGRPTSDLPAPLTRVPAIHDPHAGRFGLDGTVTRNGYYITFITVLFHVVSVASQRD